MLVHVSQVVIELIMQQTSGFELLICCSISLMLGLQGWTTFSFYHPGDSCILSKQSTKSAKSSQTFVSYFLLNIVKLGSKETLDMVFASVVHIKVLIRIEMKHRIALVLNCSMFLWERRCQNSFLGHIPDYWFQYHWEGYPSICPLVLGTTGCMTDTQRMTVVEQSAIHTLSLTEIKIKLLGDEDLKFDKLLGQI